MGVKTFVKIDDQELLFKDFVERILCRREPSAIARKVMEIESLISNEISDLQCNIHNKDAGIILVLGERGIQDFQVRACCDSFSKLLSVQIETLLQQFQTPH